MARVGTGTDARAPAPGPPAAAADKERGWRRAAVGTYRRSAAELAAVLPHAARRGCRRFDTAALYRNERATVEALSEWPDARVTTKLHWRDLTGRDRTLEAVDRSLRALGGRADTVLLHAPTDAYAACWDALLNDVCRDRVRHVGVSNFGVARLETMEGVEVNQIELSLACHRPQTVAHCVSRGIELQAYGTLRLDLATPAQCLNHVLAQGAVPVVGARTPAHLDETLGAASSLARRPLFPRYRLA